MGQYLDNSLIGTRYGGTI